MGAWLVSRWFLVLLLACDCGSPEPSRSAETPAAHPVSVGQSEESDDEATAAEHARSQAQMEQAGCAEGRVADCLALAERTPTRREEALRTLCREGGHLCALAGASPSPELLATGCRAGSLPSCRAWAKAADGEDAAEARRLGCDAGWLEGCTEAVEGCRGTVADCVNVARDKLAEGDIEAAGSLARLACDGQRTAGCVIWAEAYMERDPDAARIALQRACFAENLGACQALLLQSDLSPMERRRAEALAEALGAAKD